MPCDRHAKTGGALVALDRNTGWFDADGEEVVHVCPSQFERWWADTAVASCMRLWSRGEAVFYTAPALQACGLVVRDGTVDEDLALAQHVAHILSRREVARQMLDEKRAERLAVALNGE